MISIKNLSLKFIREYYALYDISLDIEKGEKVAFVGEEHSGKTTLLRVIAKLEKLTNGNVYINGIPLAKINFKNDLSVGYVPVKPIYLKRKTVYENFVYLLKERKLSTQEIEDRINKVLIDFNIEKFRDEKWENLSLFDQYVVSLVRIALREIDLLLVDEIFDRVSKKEAAKLVDLLLEHFFAKTNLTAIVATNNTQTANKLCKTIHYFKFGSLVESLEEKTEE